MKPISINLTSTEKDALLWALTNFESKEDCWNIRNWAAIRRIVKKIREAEKK